MCFLSWLSNHGKSATCSTLQEGAAGERGISRGRSRANSLLRLRAVPFLLFHLSIFFLVSSIDAVRCLLLVDHVHRWHSVTVLVAPLLTRLVSPVDGFGVVSIATDSCATLVGMESELMELEELGEMDGRTKK
jgi:hypothetical protein